MQGTVGAALQVRVKEAALARATRGERPDIQAGGVRGQVPEDWGGAGGVRELGEPSVHVLVVLVSVNLNKDGWRECLVLEKVSWTAEIDKKVLILAII